MNTVFISSVMRDFAEERETAKDAIESLGLKAVMAETAAASADPSKTALLGLVETSDVVVLVLPGRYGYIGASGRSPTEEEFNHAVKVGKPILVFVQEDVDRDPKQQAFIARVRGTWETGSYTASFRTPRELLAAVVRALNELRTSMASPDTVPTAQLRAGDLAAGERRGHSGGRNVRVVMVPVGAGMVLDAFALDDPAIADRVIEAARRHRVISQTAAVQPQLTSAGIVLAAQGSRHQDRAVVMFADDGAVVVETDASAEGTMGFMALSHPKAATAIAAAGSLAQDLWGLAEGGERIRQIAAAIGVPDAANCVYSMSGQTGGSMTMGSAPSPLVAPDPAVILRRNDLGQPRTSDQLLVPLRRAFADHRALTE